MSRSLHPTRPVFLVLFLGLVLAGPSRAGVGEDRRDLVLPNGLRVILIPHHANPMVASSVVVGAGVVHEPEGMNGASHFLEHLLFNGTKRRSQRELYDEADRYGAYNNATTREDHTLFTLLVQKEFAEAGLDIQADMLFHSTLPSDKFEKEKGIVLEELAKDRNEPATIAAEEFRAFAYKGTPLARPVLGSGESIAGFRREDVLAYYESRYVPANMVLVVMGDFESDRMIESVRRTFGAAKAGVAPPSPALLWPPPPEKNLRSMPLDAGRTYVHAAFPVPLAPYDPRVGAVELLVAALSEGDDAPLSRTLTSGSDPIALSFTLGVAPRGVPWGALEFAAILPKGKRPLDALGKLAEALQSKAILAEARERLPTVRAAARAGEILSADQIHYFALERSSYLLGSPEGSLGRRLAALDRVEDEAFAGAAASLGRGLAEIRALAAGPDSPDEAIAWQPPTPPAAGPPAPARESLEQELPNGLRARIERNDDSMVFAVHLLFRPRAASEVAGKGGIVDFLHRLFLRGTLVHDRATLAARVGDLGAHVKTNDDPSVPFDDYYTTPEFSFVRLEMPAQRWREGISLLGEIIRFPRWDPVEVEAVRKEMLDLQKRRAESTRARAADLVSRTLASDHPLARPVLGTAPSVSSVSLEDLRAFHTAYVAGRKMIVTVVSPVSPGEVLDSLRATLGTLPAGEKPEPPLPPPITPKGVLEEESVGKEQAYVCLAYLFDARPQDHAALLVLGSLLSDKLSFRLREERGLAYSLSASIVPFGGRMKLEVVMATRQANVDTSAMLLKEEIARFAVTDLDPAAVARAAAGLRGRLLMRRLTRVNQAYFLGVEMLEGRPAGDDAAKLGALLGVSAADVSRVAREYVDVRRCARMIVR